MTKNRIILAVLYIIIVISLVILNYNTLTSSEPIPVKVFYGLLYSDIAIFFLGTIIFKYITKRTPKSPYKTLS